jgi:large subunit ribosomal protein L2
MGKRLISQRRGRGTPTYKSPSHKYVAKAAYPYFEKPITAVVKDLVRDSARTAPLMILNSDNKSFCLPATLDVKVGDEIKLGATKNFKTGDVAYLKDVPVGENITNIELKPNDGGKICRSSGAFAKVVEKVDGKVVIRLPSKKRKELHENCRVTLGIIAGGGRTEKPWVKAGKKFHAKKAKNKLYPRTSPVSMNAVDHPFGSGRGSHIGKPMNSPRFAPPGRKAGLLRAKRTGRRKK